MDFIIDDERRYKVKYYASLKDALGKSKRELVEIETSYIVDINFNAEKKAYIEYGFEPHYYDCEAKDPGRPIERYRMHTSISPCNLILTHLQSGRVFKTGPARGKGEGIAAGLFFVCDFFENDVKVAEIHWESYYKD